MRPDAKHSVVMSVTFTVFYTTELLDTVSWCNKYLTFITSQISVTCAVKNVLFSEAEPV